jgi:hypothetical protein
MEILKLQQAQKSRQELATILRNKLQLPSTALPIPSAMIQKEGVDLWLLRDKLKVKVDSLRETQRVQDHWWPTPSLAVEYSTAITSLEADVQSAEEKIQDSIAQLDVMEIEKESVEEITVQPITGNAVPKKKETQKADRLTKVDNIEKVEEQDINLGELETLVSETAESLDNTSELVRTKNEAASDEVRKYLEAKFPPHASQEQEVARQKRVTDLLRRYSALDNRTSGYLVKLTEQQSQKVERQEELKKAMVHLENVTFCPFLPFLAFPFPFCL